MNVGLLFLSKLTLNCSKNCPLADDSYSFQLYPSTEYANLKELGKVKEKFEAVNQKAQVWIDAMRDCLSIWVVSYLVLKSVLRLWEDYDCIIFHNDYRNCLMS